MHRLSLVAASRGYFLVAVHRLLTAVASLVAPGLESTGSVVLALGLSCSMACSIASPDQGLNLCPLHWQADSLPLDHEGNPQVRSWSEKVQNMREAKDSLAELRRLERTCWYKEEKPLKWANSWRGCRRTRFVQHCGGLWRRKTWSRKRYSAILNKAENSRCLCVLVT